MKKPSKKANLAILVVVVVIISIFLYYQYDSPYGSGIVIDWRLQLIISNYRGTNYTLPEGIGTPGGIIANTSLSSLGPPGYAPLSTRDSTSTIWIQSNQVTIFTFGDFFNIWGQVLNKTCVSAQFGTYCTTPAEAVFYGPANNATYDPTTNTNLNVISEEKPHLPATGQMLSSDPRIMFYDKYSSTFRLNDTLVYDTDQNAIYDPSSDFVINATSTNNAAPPPGAMLRADPGLRFFDYNRDGVWNRAIPPPVFYDATSGSDKVYCTDTGRGEGLSNGKIWVIYIWSPFAAGFAGGCIPPGL